MKVTLRQIEDLKLYKSEWKWLLQKVGKVDSDEEVFELSDLLYKLGSAGIEIVLKILCKLKKVKLMRYFALWCANQEKHKIIYIPAIDVLNQVEFYLDKKISKEELANVIHKVNDILRNREDFNHDYVAIYAFRAAYAVDKFNVLSHAIDATKAIFDVYIPCQARKELVNKQKAKLKELIDAEK